MKVRKALIPVAGLGTRFLPATKTIPKEMLPLVDRPALLHIVEEAVSAGIEDIVLVAGRGKTAIEDFFDTSYEVEDTLEKAGKSDLLESIRRVSRLANIISIRQKRALGLGHAVFCGQPIIGEEPFAVLLGDEVMIGEPNITRGLASSYEKTGLSSVALLEVPKEDVVRYGIVEVTKADNNSWRISDVVEKPSVEKAPSRLALPGRYVFDSKVFKYLKETKPGRNGEIQLTDAMTKLAKNEGLLGLTFSTRRYDTGDKFGYLQANIELGLEHPETGSHLKKYLKELASKL